MHKKCQFRKYDLNMNENNCNQKRSFHDIQEREGMTSHKHFSIDKLHLIAKICNL